MQPDSESTADARLIRNKDTTLTSMQVTGDGAFSYSYSLVSQDPIIDCSSPPESSRGPALGLRQQRVQPTGAMPREGQQRAGLRPRVGPAGQLLLVAGLRAGIAAYRGHRGLEDGPQQPFVGEAGEPAVARGNP